MARTLITYVGYGLDKATRFFLHHEPWKAGEMRSVTAEEAKELKAHFPDVFVIEKPTPIKAGKPKATPKQADKPTASTATPPAAPAKE